MYDKSFLVNLLDGWRRESVEPKWKQRATHLLSAINSLEKATLAFDSKENEFFQTFYVEFNDGNPRSTKILTLGAKYSRAEYFFINKFVENNLATFYSEFPFKNQILAQKMEFNGKNEICVDDVLSGEMNNIVSLYIFIENITKHFGDYVDGDRDKKGVFKLKIVSFYDAIYRLFVALNNKELLKHYFDVCLHNQPMLLVEMVQTILTGQNISKIAALFDEENTLNGKRHDMLNFQTLAPDFLYYFISILSIKNPHINICMFTKNSTEILSVFMEEEIDSFAKYYEAGNSFVNEYKPYPNGEFGNDVKYLFASLFFDYLLGFEDTIKDKNLIYSGAIGTGKTHKIQEIIRIKNIPLSRRRYIQFHPNYKYSDFIDGFDEAGEFRNGEFKEFCKLAMSDMDNEYFFIINNINGANCDEIFGEAFEALEHRLEDTKDDSWLIRTKNSHIIDKFNDDKKAIYSVVVREGLSYFAIPANLYIVASHNSYESAQLGQLSRRFNWINLTCNYNILSQWLSDKKIKNTNTYARACSALNSYIKNDLALGDKFEIGHGVFAKIINDKDITELSSRNLNDFFDTVLRPILETSFTNMLGYKESLRHIKAAREIFKFD